MNQSVNQIVDYAIVLALFVDLRTTNNMHCEVNQLVHLALMLPLQPMLKQGHSDQSPHYPFEHHSELVVLSYNAACQY